MKYHILNKSVPTCIKNINDPINIMNFYIEKEYNDNIFLDNNIYEMKDNFNRSSIWYKNTGFELNSDCIDGIDIQHKKGMVLIRIILLINSEYTELFSNILEDYKIALINKNNNDENIQFISWFKINYL